jgi:phosphoribosylamine-glycine ligase
MAHKRAYEVATPIRFEGMQMRHDIGYRAMRDTSGARAKVK